jgi:hypothetical protein
MFEANKSAQRRVTGRDFITLAPTEDIFLISRTLIGHLTAPFINTVWCVLKFGPPDIDGNYEYVEKQSWKAEFGVIP